MACARSMVLSWLIFDGLPGCRLGLSGARSAGRSLIGSIAHHHQDQDNENSQKYLCDCSQIIGCIFLSLFPEHLMPSRLKGGEGSPECQPLPKPFNHIRGVTVKLYGQTIFVLYDPPNFGPSHRSCLRTGRPWVIESESQDGPGTIRNDRSTHRDYR